MKKISVIMALVILLSSVFAVPAYAANNDDVKTTQIKGTTFKYRIIDGKYAKIVKGDYFIPKEIEGYPVTVIGKKSYEDLYSDYESSNDRKWVIPDTVTCIEDEAFYNCSFQAIIIPSSVTYIGKSAFKHCFKLTAIVIPESISRIEPYTFYKCDNLATVIMRNEVTEIGEYAFADCYSLKKVNFPKDLRRIRKHAFDGCNNLLDYDFTPCREIETLEKDCITNRITNKRIISNPSDTAVKKYASDNDIECLVASDSNDSFAGRCSAGNRVTLYVDREKLIDYKTSTPKIIKLTKKGKLTALKKGTAKFKVTLPSGKVYNGTFKVLDNPVLKKKVTSGKNKGTYKEVKTVSVKQGKTVSIKLFGKAKPINNKYTSTSKAQIVSKKSATSIKIKGKAKGTSTVKIKVNGVKTLKLKVKVK